MSKTQFSGRRKIKCYFCGSGNVILTAVVRETKQKIHLCAKGHREEVLALAQKVRDAKFVQDNT